MLREAFLAGAVKRDGRAGNLHHDEQRAAVSTWGGAAGHGVVLSIAVGARGQTLSIVNALCVGSSTTFVETSLLR